ncbi:unnamed protein product, partial [Didymodactylos carnosus]
PPTTDQQPVLDHSYNDISDDSETSSSTQPDTASNSTPRRIMPRVTSQDLLRTAAPRPKDELYKMILSLRSNVTVDLSNKQLYDDDLKMIAEELRVNRKCTSLTLNSNNFTDDGIKTLCHALRGQTNKILKTLVLSSNNISDTCVQHLATMLKTNTTLQTLDLSENEIGDSGMDQLTTALKMNNSLSRLYLNNNLITDDGIRHLLQLLRRNNTLTLVNLSDNQFSREFKRNFVEELSKGHQSSKTVLL